MPGKSPPLDLKARASAWLELDPGLSSDEVRPAIWRHLAESNFLPDPATHEAILILAGRQLGSAPALELAIPSSEVQLRHAVEEFAGHFFEIPVADRRDRWEALHRAAAASPTVQARLARLAPGLTFDPGPGPTDPRVRRLAGEILSLFPTPASVRPAWLREFAYRLDGDPDFKRSARRRALRTLTRQYPTIAALGPDYIQRVGLMPRLAWLDSQYQRLHRKLTTRLRRPRRPSRLRMLWARTANFRVGCFQLVFGLLFFMLVWLIGEIVKPMLGWHNF